MGAESLRAAGVPNRVVALRNGTMGFELAGFVCAHGASAGATSYEVRRILKAFVDAQWLAEFDARLASYQSQLAGVTPAREETGHE